MSYPKEYKKHKNSIFGKLSKINKYIPSFLSKTINEENEAVQFHAPIFNTTTLLSVSDLKGKINFVNDRFCKVSKFERKELIGKSHSAIFHPDTPLLLLREMCEKLKKGNTWQGEIKSIAKDGTFFWVSTIITPIIGEENKPIKYVGVHRDISYKKKMEQELKEFRKIIDLDLYEHVNYAKQIHSALLTNEEEIRNTFPKSFLIYKAQKIISGDFYGLYKQNNKSIIVLGDSTGHGVSASYISILALNIINSALKTGFNHPEEILQTVHSEMHNVTHINNKYNIKESADTIICSIDHDTYKLNYASAKMRGIIIRNNEIIELNKDKCSIGEFSNKPLQLTKHSLQLKRKDCIYLFSDGIVDQFGGDNDKKFGYKKLQKTLKQNVELSMHKQKEAISTVFKNWQGNKEQTDDMTILGLQIE
jgi:PAS domain S-box-containing protein